MAANSSETSQMFQFKLDHWFHAALSAAVGKRLLRLAPGMVWQRDSFGNALLERAEYFIEHSDSLAGLGADSNLNGHMFQYFVDSSPLHLDT